jgi:iron complex transport system substrate-binding protein
MIVDLLKRLCWLSLVLAAVISCSKSAPPNGDVDQKRSADFANVAPPSRVVVIGPSSVETLFALGAGEFIVAVSDFCKDPRAVNLPRVGGQFDPNLERIAALNPDAVITQGSNPRLAELCEQLQILFISLNTDSVQSWLDEVKNMGELFHMQSSAQSLTDEFQKDYQRLADAVGTRTKAAILISRNGVDGMIAVGSGSFLNELLQAAGGENVFADNPNAYFNLSQEALLDAAPQVLLDLSIAAASKPNGTGPSNADVWAEFAIDFPTLPAIADKRIFALSKDYLFLPGPRMLQTVGTFSECLAAPSNR